MLVLTRQEGETILIYPEEGVDPDMTVGELFANGPIPIGIADIQGKSIKIAIDAPLALEILRSELVE